MKENIKKIISIEQLTIYCKFELSVLLETVFADKDKMAKNDTESRRGSSAPFRPTYGTAGDGDEDVSSKHFQILV